MLEVRESMSVMLQSPIHRCIQSNKYIYTGGISNTYWANSSDIVWCQGPWCYLQTVWLLVMFQWFEVWCWAQMEVQKCSRFDFKNLELSGPILYNNFGDVQGVFGKIEVRSSKVWEVWSSVFWWLIEIG